MELSLSFPKARVRRYSLQESFSSYFIFPRTKQAQVALYKVCIGYSERTKLDQDPGENTWSFRKIAIPSDDSVNIRHASIATHKLHVAARRSLPTTTAFNFFGETVRASHCRQISIVPICAAVDAAIDISAEDYIRWTNTRSLEIVAKNVDMIQLFHKTLYTKVRLVNTPFIIAHNPMPK